MEDADLAKTTWSCSLHRDRRTPVATRSVEKKVYDIRHGYEPPADAPLVSPVWRDRGARHGSHACVGVVLANAAKRKRRQTYTRAQRCTAVRLVYSRTSFACACACVCRKCACRQSARRPRRMGRYACRRGPAHASRFHTALSILPFPLANDACRGATLPRWLRRVRVHFTRTAHIETVAHIGAR